MNTTPNGTLARLLIVGLFLSPLLGIGQKVEIGAAAGGMLYTGDVAPTLNPKFVRPGGGLFFRYNVSRAFAARAQVSLGRIIGTDSITTDAYQIARGAAFRNTIREVALLGEYKFRNYTPLRNVKNWTPYVFGGLAVFSHGLRQPGDKPVEIAFPLGVGVKYEIARPWSIGLEYTTRFTTTDNLDGLGIPPAGATKLNQSDPDRKDHYTMVFLTVSYTFYRIFCPPGSN
ncbi:type IX secretion system protein PorG [Fibrivirga algicola]|uniref:type IX secretion system protein PorG n=1 Tax=Fibrivirga algicola TaxID=2950420 RepID=UPI00286E8C7F|nr:DUF6089 family protein [Fibrivirga algicola]